MKRDICEICVTEIFLSFFRLPHLKEKGKRKRGKKEKGRNKGERVWRIGFVMLCLITYSVTFQTMLKQTTNTMDRITNNMIYIEILGAIFS